MVAASRIVVAAAALLLAESGAADAASRSSTDARRCSTASGIKADVRIAACTALIKGGHIGGPELAKAYRDRAEPLLAKGRTADAIADLDTAVKLDPFEHRGYALRGQLYLQMHRFDKAAADFTSAISLDPKDVESFVGRARALE
jgi:tetratricopeptide (TPR) repeat protein